MGEVEQTIKILEETQEALKKDNSLKLKHLSDQTIHSVSAHQHTDYLIIATLVYALSKIIERKRTTEIKNWSSFVKRFNSDLSSAIKALKDKNQKEFLRNLENARKNFTNISVNLKPMIQEVLRKASINKASRIYEHGVSLGKTSKLLGISQWELSEYIGQKAIDPKYNRTINIKQRVKLAMEFFK